MLRSAVLVALLASFASAHPTYYPEIYRNESCYNPEPAQIFSYHIHLVYLQTNQKDTEDAYKIRDKFRVKFASKMGPDCHDLFHNEYTCILDPDVGPAGPFPVANWSVFVLPEHLELMMAWMTQNRGRFSVLVHPNSGCEVEDHSDWTFWSGNPYPLDLTIFSHDRPFPWLA